MSKKDYKVIISFEDLEELERPKHKELKVYLDKLNERFGIRIEGIDLTKSPRACNKRCKNSYVFT